MEKLEDFCTEVFVKNRSSVGEAGGWGKKRDASDHAGVCGNIHRRGYLVPGSYTVLTASEPFSEKKHHSTNESTGENNGGRFRRSSKLSIRDGALDGS